MHRAPSGESGETVYSFRPGLARSLSQWDVNQTGAAPGLPPSSSSSWELARPNTSSSGSSTFSSPAPYHARLTLQLIISLNDELLSRIWRLGNTDTFTECNKLELLISKYNVYFLRRWKKEKEEWNLANGINFSYTSPFMSDNSSIVKA